MGAKHGERDPELRLIVKWLTEGDKPRPSGRASVLDPEFWTQIEEDMAQVILSNPGADITRSL